MNRQPREILHRFHFPRHLHVTTSPLQFADPTERSGRSAESPFPVNQLDASVLSLDALSPAELDRWESIRGEREDFRSPFFSVAFSKAVQRARGDVSVAVICRGGSIVAFLPFHRIGRRGYPVGRFFNDAHNLIAPANERITWSWLLNEIGLKTYEFHALAGSDPDEFPHHTCHETIRSFRCEIGDDSRGYLERLGRQHKTIGRQGQKTRKMAREVGPVQLELDCRSREALQQNIQLKRDQYARTHILDLFQPDWTNRLMEELFDRPDSDRGEARGILSVLRAGDQIVASHYGILEHGLLHYWFPAYDPQYRRYSPGTGLFCSLVKNASAHGIWCVDMGYGEQSYKPKQTDATGSVAKGCIADSRVYRQFRCVETRVVNAAKKLPAKEPLKRVWRTIWPSAGISKLT